MANQIAGPDTDKDANIPVHPGAKLYFDGEEKTIFDKYGDQFFYATLVLGSITSALAAVWRFLVGDNRPPGGRLVDRVGEIAARIRSAHTEAELEAVEGEIDVLLRSEFDGLDSRQAALNLAAARLERLIRLQSDKLSASMRSAEPATG